MSVYISCFLFIRFWSWNLFEKEHYNLRSWSGSLSIVSDYRLYDWDSNPAEPKGFSSSLYVQTSSEAHPASYPIGSGSPFPGGKAGPERDADNSPHLVPRSRMSRSYTSSPPWRLYGGSVTALLLHCNVTWEQIKPDRQKNMHRISNGPLENAIR
jgi:hypothetical protein